MSASRDLTLFDSLAIEGLRVDCIIGLFPKERVTPQPLELDVTVYLPSHHCDELGIAGTVDYGCLAGELRFLLTSSRFLFIEQAAESLARYVLAPPAQDEQRVAVHAVTVKMRKPSALKGQGVPSISMTRFAGDLPLSSKALPTGMYETVSELNAPGHSVSIERLQLAPKESWRSEDSGDQEVHELILTEGLLVRGEPIRRGMSLHWAPHQVRRYDNLSSKFQTMLRVSIPSAPEHAGSLPQSQLWYPTGD